MNESESKLIESLSLLLTLELSLQGHGDDTVRLVQELGERLATKLVHQRRYTHPAFISELRMALASLMSRVEVPADIDLIVKG